jgi:hypothetical protein
MAAKIIEAEKFASALYNILSEMSASELVDRVPQIYDVVAEHFSPQVERKLEETEELSGVYVIPNFVFQKRFGE